MMAVRVAAGRSAIPLRRAPQPIAFANTPGEAVALCYSPGRVAVPRSQSIESAIPAAAAACLQALPHKPPSDPRTATEMNTGLTQYGACSAPKDGLFARDETGAF